MSDNVTRDELKAHIEPIKHTMHTFQAEMQKMQKECANNSANTLYLAREMKTMQDMQGLAVNGLSTDMATTKQDMATMKAYWKIAGFVIGTMFVAVCGLIVDRLFS